MSDDELAAMFDNKSGMMPLAWLEVVADLRDARAEIARLSERLRLAEAVVEAARGDQNFGCLNHPTLDAALAAFDAGRE